MKRFFLILGAAGLMQTVTVRAKLEIVATTADLGSIAEAVGGDRVNVTTLARPAEDPHFVDPKPSFIVKLNRADAIVRGGAELEAGWLPSLLAGARNPRLAPGGKGDIACNQGIEMLDVPVVLDRSRGDIHAAGNPHFTVDPENAKIIARHMAEALSRLEAANADTFQANAGRFIGELEAKLAAWQKTLEPYRGEHIVCYHNSWVYFGRRFGFRMELFLEPKPGIPPSPAHLAGIVSKMKASAARVIIVDPYLNRRTAETVARNTGARVVDVSQFPGGLKGTEKGYIALMDAVVNAIAQAFRTKP